MFRSLGIQGLVQGVGDASSHPLAHSPSLTDSLGCWSLAHSLMDSLTLLLTSLRTHGLPQAFINSSCVDSHDHLVPQLTVNLLTHLHTPPHLTNIVPLVFTKTQSFTNLLRHSVSLITDPISPSTKSIIFSISESSLNLFFERRSVCFWWFFFQFCKMNEARPHQDKCFSLVHVWSSLISFYDWTKPFILFK